MIDGNKFKDARHKLGLSQKELAKGVTTQATISSIERNASTPSGDVTAKLLSRLGLSMAEVVSNSSSVKADYYLNQADKYMMNFQYNEALEALNHIKSTIDSSQEAHFLFLKTNVETWISKNYEDTIFGYNRVLQIEISRQNIYVILATCELGMVYARKSDEEKEKYYFERVSEMLKDIGLNAHPFWSLFLLDKLSKYYSNTRQYRKCEKILKMGINLAKENVIPYFMDSFYYLYSSILHGLNNKWTKEATGYMVKAWSFASFLNNPSVIRRATDQLRKLGYNL